MSSMFTTLPPTMAPPDGGHGSSQQRVDGGNDVDIDADNDALLVTECRRQAFTDRDETAPACRQSECQELRRMSSSSSSSKSLDGRQLAATAKIEITDRRRKKSCSTLPSTKDENCQQKRRKYVVDSRRTDSCSDNVYRSPLLTSEIVDGTNIITGSSAQTVENQQTLASLSLLSSSDVAAVNSEFSTDIGANFTTPLNATTIKTTPH